MDPIEPLLRKGERREGEFITEKLYIRPADGRGEGGGGSGGRPLVVNNWKTAVSALAAENETHSLSVYQASYQPSFNSHPISISDDSAPAVPAAAPYAALDIAGVHIVDNESLPAQCYIGSTAIYILTVAAVAVAYIMAVYNYRLAGLGLLTLSLLPVVLVITLCSSLKTVDDSQTAPSALLPVALALETFWAGAILSIGAASILEMISQYQTRQVWKCQTEAPSLVCDLKFVAVVVIGVGLVEEFSKLLPLGRLRTTTATVPRGGYFWFRVVPQPRSFALAGLCAAAGFAGIENVKYVFSEGANWSSWGTSVWRAVLAIPFHLACTTYAAAILAGAMYKINSSENRNDSTDPINMTPRPGALTTEPVSVSAIATGSSPTPKEPVSRLFDTKEPSLLNFAIALAVPSLLHGLYDSGLFLAVQFVSHAGGAEGSNPGSAANSIGSKVARLLASAGVSAATAPLTKWLSLPAMLVNKPLYDLSSLLAAANSSDASGLSSASDSDLYITIGCCCVGVSLTAYLLMLTLAIRKYTTLPKVVNSSVVPATPPLMTPLNGHGSDGRTSNDGMTANAGDLRVIDNSCSCGNRTRVNAS